MLLKVWKSTYQQQSSAWKPSAKEQFAQYWAWKLRYRSFVIETGCLCFRRLSSICATTHTRRWVFHIIFSISICLKSFSLSWKNLERKWKEVRKQILLWYFCILTFFLLFYTIINFTTYWAWRFIKVSANCLWRNRNILKLDWLLANGNHLNFWKEWFTGKYSADDTRNLVFTG